MMWEVPIKHDIFLPRNFHFLFRGSLVVFLRVGDKPKKAFFERSSQEDTIRFCANDKSSLCGSVVKDFKLSCQNFRFRKK